MFDKKTLSNISHLYIFMFIIFDTCDVEHNKTLSVNRCSCLTQVKHFFGLFKMVSFYKQIKKSTELTVNMFS